MASSHLDVGDVDFRELEEFLMSDRVPENCMQLSDLDGFLTAIAIGPELIMPSEWLPVIWGDGEPQYESLDEAKRVIAAIMGRYNAILQLLQHEPDAYGPLFWQTRDGQVLAADWAEGFMDGVRLRFEAWQTLVDSDEAGQFLAPIVAFLHDQDGKPAIEGEVEELAEIRRRATGLIAPCIVAIHRFWKSHHRASRRTPRPGRNDPCPCGSGHKYKRCCGKG